MSDHPPLPVRRACDVDRDDVQEHIARRVLPGQRSQVPRVSQHQRRRQQVLGEQPLRSIAVGHDGREEAGPLRHARLDLRPLVAVQQERHQVERPRPLAAALVLVDVVGDAVVAHLALDGLATPRQVGEAAGAEMREELAPQRTQRARFVAQFVAMARRGGQRHPGRNGRRVAGRIELEQALRHADHSQVARPAPSGR